MWRLKNITCMSGVVWNNNDTSVRAIRTRTGYGETHKTYLFNKLIDTLKRLTLTFLQGCTTVSTIALTFSRTLDAKETRIKNGINHRPVKRSWEIYEEQYAITQEIDKYCIKINCYYGFIELFLMDSTTWRHEASKKYTPPKLIYGRFMLNWRVP